MGAENNVIIEFIGDTSKLDAANDQIMADQNQLTVAIQQTNQKAAASVAPVIDANKKLNDSFRNINQTIATGAMKEYANDINKIGGDMKKAADGAAHFRAEFMQARNELRNMYLTGQTTGKTFDDLVKKVGEFERASINANSAIENTGRKFLALRASAEGIRTIGAVYETAIGATALWGDKNEDLEKSLRQLMGVMALVNGLTEISTALEEESALRKGLTAAKNWILTTSTTAYGIAQGVLAGEIGIATAAQMVFNAAAALFPATAIVLAITAAVEIFVLWRMKVGELAESLRELALGQKVNSDYELASIDRRMKARELEGRQTYELEKERIAAQKKALQEENDIINTKMEKGIELKDEEIEFNKTYFRELSKLRTDDVLNEEKYQKELEKIEQETALRRLKSKPESRGNDIATLLQEREAQKKALDAQTEDTKLHDAAMSAFAEETRKLINDINKKWDEKEAADRKKELDDIKKDNDKYLSTEIEALELRRQKEVAGSKEDLELYKQIQQQKLNLAVNDGLNTDKESQEYKNFLENQLTEYDKYIGALGIKALAESKKSSAEIRANNEADLQVLETQEKAKRDAIINNNNSTEEEKKKANLDFYNFELSFINQELDANEAAYKKDEISYAEYVKRKAALLAQASGIATSIPNLDIKDHEKDEHDAAKASIKIAQDTSNAVFQIESENRQRLFNDQISKLNKQKDAELANTNLTAAQRAAITESFAKKEAALKLQNWKAEKQSKLEQAIINTALAITNSLATAPWPANLIAAVGAAVAGAAQIAVIESQKPPAFAKGTKSAPEGMALVGEEGPELVHLPGGAKVVTHPETKAIMDKYNIPQINVPEVESVKAIGTNGPVFDHRRFAKAFAEELKNNPHISIKIDKGGFALHVIEKNKRVERLNNRYRTK